MHGAAEALAIIVFVGTMLAVFILRLMRPSKPVFVTLLVGIWPLLWGLFEHGRQVARDPSVMSIWLAATCVTLIGAISGSLAARASLKIVDWIKPSSHP